MQSTTRRMAKQRAANWLIVASILVIGVNAASAIVQKQQQQSSQQQRSDEPSQQSAYNHNQQVGVSSPAQSASSSSSSIGSNGQQQQHQAAAATNNPNQQQQSGPSSGGQSYGSPVGGISAVQPGASYVNNVQKQAPTYMDQMAAAASNPEQSYQAAAQSVNMALANQGILSNGLAYNNQAGAQQSGQQSTGQANAAAGSALSPLHYLYYPASKESIQGPSKQADAMASSASNQYPYTNYQDQYQPSYGNSPGPDVAASSQEASYMAQPLDGSIQAQPQHQQQQAQHQHHQQQQHNFNQNDLATYASNQMQQQQQPQQQPSSVSFGGPAAGQTGNQMGQGNNQASSVNDYLNSHMGGHQQQQQQAAGAPSYQQNGQNMFNQLASGGDLSTSNFGNNAGGMSSIASYMAPTGGANQNGQQNAHDLFASALLGGNQFNSAASQLSPSSISPPAASASVPNNGQQQQQQQQPQQSMFSSSLFGGQPQQQQGQVPAQQQANGGLYGDASNFLNSYMTPQQYSQLTGQQMPMASEHSLGLANAIGVQQAQQAQQAQHAVNSATTSSKRFGLGSFIMPVLALAGLSLLIPTMSSLGTAAVGRKKRSIVEEKASAADRQQQIAYEPLLNGPSQLLKEGSLSEYLNRIERYYGIYKNAIESDECRNRLICEFGDAVKDIGGTGPVMSVIEKMVPSWMANKMSLFKEAAMNSREGKERCKMYACKSSIGASRQH